MFVTLTPNPGIDRTYAVGAVVRGEVLRAPRDWVEAGGKGINVARVLHAHGADARAVLPVGGPTGRAVTELLEAAGLELRPVPIAGDLRCNVTLTEESGAVTKVNAAGPRLADDELEALLSAAAAAVAEQPRWRGLRRGARPTTWFVACGSLTPGAPDDLLARAVARVRAAAPAARIAIDTSGPALAAALAVRPDVVKPNLSELEELCGRPLSTLGEVVDAAAGVVAAGVGTVLVSLGPEGAVLVDGERALHAEAPRPAVVRTTVGAGDALLSGYLRSVDHGPEEALRTAVAFGTAAVARTIGAVVGPDDLDVPAVRVTAGFDRDRPSRARSSGPAGATDAVPAVPSGIRAHEGEAP